jgi:hypothetical protein
MAAEASRKSIAAGDPQMAAEASRKRIAAGDPQMAAEASRKRRAKKTTSKGDLPPRVPSVMDEDDDVAASTGSIVAAVGVVAGAAAPGASGLATTPPWSVLSHSADGGDVPAAELKMSRTM